MEAEVILNIHNEFNDYFKGAQLTGSYSLFAPFYKVSLKTDYIFETQLTILEQFICKCLRDGITTQQDMSYVLGLPIDAVISIINHLEANKYLTSTDKGIAFTEIGLELFEINLKREGEQKTINIFYDGLSPEYKIEFFGREVYHQFVKYNAIPEDLKSNTILPKTFPQYNKENDFLSLSKKMLPYLNDLEKDVNSSEPFKKIITINDFTLENKREIFYHEYRILVFQRQDGKSNLLAYDPCGDEFIDQRVTHSLQKLHEENELSFGFEGQNEVAIDMKVIIDVLKNYVASSELTLSNEDKEESIQKLEFVEQGQDSSRYIMNYEIRKKFLYYLKNAKESLYLISPWMNSYVVNDNLIEDITNLLERGVKISIIYGINNISEKMDDRDRKTNKLADKLKRLGKQYNGLLTIKHGQTHEKLLICDGKYYINGSFNFLSYSGEEDGKFFRNEGSTYSENSILIEETIKLRFREGMAVQ